MKKASILILIVIAFQLYSCKSSTDKKEQSKEPEKALSIDDNKVSIYSSDITEVVHIVFAPDTHLSISDERENNFKKYSERMSGAYKVTQHFKTGEDTNPRKAFRETLAYMKETNADLLVLGGDIFSYPSEAVVEWTRCLLDSVNINFAYTCGNHDWHYEGMEGSSIKLREEWINERLLPMYDQGVNPLMYSVDVKGVRVVMIDNSVYEILPEQLEFFQEQVKSGKPLLLCMHIPLYAKGRPVGYGCGHPDWNAANDTSFELERREPWSVEGHSDTTFKFREEVINAPNLLAVFCGHCHQPTLDMIGDTPQFVAKMNACGGFYDIYINPNKE